MRFTGKAQQRPLDLLKLLVALGGSDVDTQQTDGRAVAGCRWRRGQDLVRHDALSPAQAARRRACADPLGGQAVARALGRVDRRGSAQGRVRCRRSRGPARREAPPRWRAPPARLLDAYPGPLLGAEEHRGSPSRATRCGRGSCARWRGSASASSRTATFATAIDVYRRGLEADNLAESFYRGLMRALAATGDKAEALNAFRRCRELLSIVLGVQAIRRNGPSVARNRRGAHPRKPVPILAVSHR